MPNHRNAYLYLYSIRSVYDLDLWPMSLKPFQQCPPTWWIFVPSFIEISSLSKEIPCHVLMDRKQTDGHKLMGIPQLGKCTGHSETLKTFSAIPTHTMIVCDKFQWNPSTVYRDISRETGVNVQQMYTGQTAGQQTQKHITSTIDSLTANAKKTCAEWSIYKQST